MNEIILFTNDCLKCKILKEILDREKIKYTIEKNLKEIIDLNFKTIPILKFKDKYYNYLEAVNLINSSALNNY